MDWDPEFLFSLLPIFGKLNFLMPSNLRNEVESQVFFTYELKFRVYLYVHLNLMHEAEFIIEISVIEIVVSTTLCRFLKAHC